MALAPGLSVQLRKVSSSTSGPIPVGYWCKGTLLASITVSQPIRMDREEQAPQSADEPEVNRLAGLFTSSPVRAFDRRADGVIEVRTMNSVWEVTTL